LVVELFEHDVPRDIDWIVQAEWIQGTALPAMARAGYSHVR
jgi:hypothetical protein